MNKEQLNEELFQAVENNNVKEVKELIEKGADVNAKDDDSWTVLMWATYKGFIDIIKLLIEKDADVNVKNRLSWTALMYAVKNDSLNIDIEIVKFLIEKGADVNAKCEDDWTILMRIANTEYLNLVNFLIENKADVNTKNKFSWTALMFAVKGGFIDIVKLLIKKGADVNAKNKNGETALSIAKINNNKTIIKLLKKNGSKRIEYFFIDILGNLDDDELCLLSKKPKGIGIKYYKMAEGLPIGNDYPHPAEIHMSEEYEGLKLASLIGHVNSYLVLEHQVVQVIQKYCPNIVIEYLPFTLINHKGQTHSENYFIVNPIGSFDCLNHKFSQITYHKKEISRINLYILDSNKLKSAPAIFRIPEMPNKYIINEELAKAFNEYGFTNIILTEIDQK